MEYIPAKTLITRNKDKNWFGTSYTMNIYKGCSHGCIYCDSRSSCYQINHFNEVRAKENAIEIIKKQLRGRMEKGVIGTGSMSDPYNPFEEKYELTRQALKMINKYRFGVAIATKSQLVKRDIDLLSEIKQHSPVIVKMTVTTSNDSLSQMIEPHVCSSSQRFKAIREMADAGVFCGLLMMPILPFIEDQEKNIREIVGLAAENGARFIYPTFGMTCRNGQREYFYQQLDKHFPGMKQEYEKQFGNNYYCNSPDAKRLWELFTQLCQKYGILYKMPYIIKAYQDSCWQYEQLSLF